MIYVDMDGVLADMCEAWLQRAMLFEGSEVPATWPRGKAVPWAKSFRQSPQFWESTKRDEAFWAHLSVLEGAQLLLEGVEWLARRYRRGRRILTKVSGGYPAMLTGKIRWTSQHFPAWVPRLQFASARFPKSDQAGPRNVLIDDDPYNVEEFIAAGGAAVLYPSVANSRHVELDAGGCPPVLAVLCEVELLLRKQDA